MKETIDDNDMLMVLIMMKMMTTINNFGQATLAVISFQGAPHECRTNKEKGILIDDRFGCPISTQSIGSSIGVNLSFKYSI